jgi:hypothetical protein
MNEIYTLFNGLSARTSYTTTLATCITSDLPSWHFLCGNNTNITVKDVSYIVIDLRKMELYSLCISEGKQRKTQWQPQNIFMAVLFPFQMLALLTCWWCDITCNVYVHLTLTPLSNKSH